MLYLYIVFSFFQVEDGIRAAHKRLEFRRVLFRSAHTVATYAHSFTIRVRFAAEHRRSRPIDLQVEDLDPDLILTFLDHIENGRQNSISTRNARLAARSEEHTSELQSLMRISYAVFCLKKTKNAAACTFYNISHQSYM